MMKLVQNALSPLTPVVFGLCFLGCPGAGEGEGEGEEDPVFEACEHMVDGPDVDVTATLVLAGSPDVSDPHTRYDVVLVDDQGGAKVGSVAFGAAEATDHTVFLNADIPIAFFDGAGAPFEIEESITDVAQCTEVKAGHTVEFPVGTVEIRLGPTAESSVSLVIEAGAHDHE